MDPGRLEVEKGQGVYRWMVEAETPQRQGSVPPGIENGSARRISGFRISIL